MAYKVSDILESDTSLMTQLVNMRAIRDQMLLVKAQGIMKDRVQEYQINDGQSIVRFTYKSFNDLDKHYKEILKLIIELENQLLGRNSRLINLEHHR
jgi:hypothetical protein